MDPLTQGRSYYKRGDYEGALEAFTEASVVIDLDRRDIF